MTLPVCPCGADAVVFAPGTDAQTTVAGIVLVRPVADRAWCIACASLARVWPWTVAVQLPLVGL